METGFRDVALKERLHNYQFEAACLFIVEPARFEFEPTATFKHNTIRRNDDENLVFWGSGLDARWLRKRT